MIKVLKYSILPEKTVEKLEKKYKLKYIGDFESHGTLDFVHGGLVFYQPEPDLSKGHSNYVMIFSQNGGLYIKKWDKLKFKGVKAGDDILISCHRHHYHEQDGVFIDGGFDYVRTNGEIVDVELINGELIKI